ncbi:MAG: hypothetical protein HOV96_31695 [Nonomuraea sp.]|nr:hypothetical protein [Nonomuraea sp.]NUP64264.1 hypothetical protein [Nonomuraea sp.]NUP82112.1 hypothetical protein [Nonomuraea sp.]NUS08255.1 hypothetical protein [Nonomuraea sp.]NUT09250.1 hypothetical protein [Nonomuraea sp.]
MATQREIHITSTTIAKTRERVESELKTGMISFVKGLIPLTAVDGLGFGVLGNLIIGGTYDGVREHAEGLMTDAEGALDGWGKALTVGERNWRAAEDASIIQYRS